MSELAARTVVIEYEFGATVRGADGFEAEFLMDDSFRSWRQIVRWNVHYHHWGAVRLNARDLFTKVIWRKVRIWPLS